MSLYEEEGRSLYSIEFVLVKVVDETPSIQTKFDAIPSTKSAGRIATLFGHFELFAIIYGCSRRELFPSFDST